MIYYKLSADNPAAHLFNVELVISAADPSGQKVSLPNWIPGSYLIRDFARHIVTIEAYRSDGKVLSAISIDKIDSNTWQCEQVQGTVIIKYVVYAWDFSVRGAHLDENHAFINPCVVLLQVCDQESACQLTLNPPNSPSVSTWRVATTLTAQGSPGGFGNYLAASYDELIDHPIIMGQFDLIEFEVANTVHQIAVLGNHDGDLARLAQDVRQICEVHIALFQEKPPFNQYLFLLMVLKEGFGGLEHRSSAALVCQREALPLRGETWMNRNYINLLALFSHEYFHAWNVKRIKPAVFMPYNLNQKGYTQQLWAFEGITSYYDELALLRARVISLEQYLDLLAQSFTRLLRNPGRRKQTLAQASFDAWIKFYQPNENTPNALVSYYLKGSLVGLAIDLTLLEQSGGKKSLDDIMRKLWHDYGKKNIGVPEGKIEEILVQEGGEVMKALLEKALYTTHDLPFEKFLQSVGLQLTLRSAHSNDDLGGKKPLPETTFRPGYFGFNLSKNQNKMIISQVFTDSAAMLAGLSAHDEIVAINGLRIEPESFEKISKRLRANQEIKIHLFRQDVLMEKTLILQQPPLDTAQITVMETRSDFQKKNLATWLK